MVIALSVENKKGGWEMSSDPADPLVVCLFHLPLSGHASRRTG